MTDYGVVIAGIADRFPAYRIEDLGHLTWTQFRMLMKRIEEAPTSVTRMVEWKTR